MGKKWIYLFFRRHPEIAAKKRQRLEAERFETKRSEIKIYFSRLNVPEIRTIPLSRKWNMDEGGLIEGLGSRGLVIGSSAKKATFVKEPERGTWISFVECVSATSQVLPPLVILRGAILQQQKFPDGSSLNDLADWKFAISKHSYTLNNIVLKWLRVIFIPAITTPSRERSLLILNRY